MSASELGNVDATEGANMCIRVFWGYVIRTRSAKEFNSIFS